MKKTLKKILASVLVAVMVLTAAPLSGFVGLKFNNNLDWLDFSLKSSALDLSEKCDDTGHLWGEWSEFSSGVSSRSCVNCGKTENKLLNEFCLNKIEETDSYVIVGVSLKSGAFNALDLQVNGKTKAIGKCVKVVDSDYLVGFSKTVYMQGSFCDYAAYEATRRFAMATIIEYTSNDESFILYKFNKSTQTTVTENDFELIIDNCLRSNPPAINNDKVDIVINYNITDEHIHSYTAKITAPTCATQGYTTYTCSVCKDSYKADYVDALGHSYNSVVITPTCTEKGYTIHTCSVCNDSYIDSYESAKGHTEGEWKVTKPVTSTETGIKTLYCAVCGAVIRTEVIPKLNPSTAKVKSVSIGDVSLNYKGSAKINTSIDDDSGVKYKVSYKSSDSSIASVDDNGNVYGAKKWGKKTATITCTVTDERGNSVSDTANVTVGFAWWQWIIGTILFGFIWY